MALDYEFFSPAVREAYSREQVATMQQFCYSINEIEENALKKLASHAPRPANAQTGHHSFHLGPFNNINVGPHSQPNFINGNYGNSGFVNNGFPLGYGQQSYPSCFSGPYYGPVFHTPPPPPPPPAAVPASMPIPHWQLPVAVNPQLFAPQLDQSEAMDGLEQGQDPAFQADDINMPILYASAPEEHLPASQIQPEPESDSNQPEVSNNPSETDPEMISRPISYGLIDYEELFSGTGLNPYE